MRDMSAREREILGKVIQILKKHLAPGRIFLFGSRAKGQSQKGSDFDVAVDHRMPEVRERRRISEEIEKAAGLYRVDVVYLKSVDKKFRELVLKSGKTIDG